MCVYRVLKRMRDVLDRLEEPDSFSLSQTPIKVPLDYIGHPAIIIIDDSNSVEIPITVLPFFVLITIETNSFESMEPFFLCLIRVGTSFIDIIFFQMLTIVRPILLLVRPKNIFHFDFYRILLLLQPQIFHRDRPSPFFS